MSCGDSGRAEGRDHVLEFVLWDVPAGAPPLPEFPDVREVAPRQYVIGEPAQLEEEHIRREPKLARVAERLGHAAKTNYGVLSVFDKTQMSAYQALLDDIES